MALAAQVLGDRGSDVAGPGDRDLHARSPTARRSRTPLPRLSNRRSSSPTASLSHREVQDVTLLADEVGDIEAGHAGPGDRHDR